MKRGPRVCTVSRKCRKKTSRGGHGEAEGSKGGLKEGGEQIKTACKSRAQRKKGLKGG